MQSVQQAVPHLQQAAEAHEQPRGRPRPQEVQVLPLRQGFQVQASPEGTREDPHRGEALRVQELRQKVGRYNITRYFFFLYEIFFFQL